MESRIITETFSASWIIVRIEWCKWKKKFWETEKLMKESAMKFSISVPHSQPPWCHHPNNIWQEIQIINVITMKFSHTSCHLLPHSFEPSSSALHSRARCIHVYLVNLFKVSTAISWKISCPNLVAQQNYMGRVRPAPSAVAFQHNYSINCWAPSVLTGI
jgi:hypothetical protein